MFAILLLVLCFFYLIFFFSYLNCRYLSLAKFRKFAAITSSSTLQPLSLFALLLGFWQHEFFFFDYSPTVAKAQLIFFLFCFSLCFLWCLDWVISIVLYSSSLILSTFPSILLLTLCTEFLFVIAFFTLKISIFLYLLFYIFSFSKTFYSYAKSFFFSFVSSMFIITW